MRDIGGGGGEGVGARASVTSTPSLSSHGSGGPSSLFDSPGTTVRHRTNNNNK